MGGIWFIERDDLDKWSRRVAALDMQWPSCPGPSQDQTTWRIFIIWIVFNHFGIAKDFSGFLHTDSTSNALVSRVFGELKLLCLEFLSYLVDQRHVQFSFCTIFLVYTVCFEQANAHLTTDAVLIVQSGKDKTGLNII